MTFYQFTKTTLFPFVISLIFLALIIISYATGFYTGAEEGSFSLPRLLMWCAILYAGVTFGAFRRQDTEESPLFIYLQIAVTLICAAIVAYFDFF